MLLNKLCYILAVCIIYLWDSGVESLQQKSWAQIHWPVHL